MRKFAFFLPQFHEIPENNIWWGNGFTEWTNVKAAKPLYHGHKQPLEPLNHNYYNLLDRETVEWQTSLMHDYSIDGFIYYHYYFTGRKLLERPAENLLKWRDISQPFFFCWANHSWFRSWEGSKELLLKQEYGGKEEWEEHFNYLLPFFKDSRYEKKNNCPLFMLFIPNFKEKVQMIQFFDEKCRENGFNGICIIESYSNSDWEKALKSDSQTTMREKDYIFIREPSYVTSLYFQKIKYSPVRVIRKIKRILCENGVRSCVARFDGKSLYNLMIKFSPQNSRIIRGAFFSWDNTPRHSERGYIISPPRKEQFFSFMDSRKEDEYLFFNAWNEWAEGMIMEPTEGNGYTYLRWIQEWTKNNE